MIHSKNRKLTCVAGIAMVTTLLLVNAETSAQERFTTLCNGYYASEITVDDSGYTVYALADTMIDSEFKRYVSIQRINKYGETGEIFVLQPDSLHPYFNWASEMAYYKSHVLIEGDSVFIPIFNYGKDTIGESVIVILKNQQLVSYHRVEPPSPTGGLFSITNMIRLPNGNLAISGTYFEKTNKGRVSFIRVYTKDWKIVWTKSYGCGAMCNIEVDQMEYYNNYLTMVCTKSWDYKGGYPQRYNIRMYRLDTSGQEIWSRAKISYDYNFNNPVYISLKHLDGFYLWYANTSFTPDYDHPNPTYGAYFNPNSTLHLVKYDRNGHEIWEKSLNAELDRHYGEDSFIYYYPSYATSLQDSSFILVGNANSWHSNLLLINFSKDGHLTWIRNFTLEQPDTLCSQETVPIKVKPTMDGGFVISGLFSSQHCEKYPNAFYQSLIIKADKHGCIIDSCFVSVKDKNLQGLLRLSPNPTLDQTFNISVSYPFEIQEVLVYNHLGRLLYSDWENHSLTVPGKGMYFVEVVLTNGEHFVQKLISN